MRFIKIFSFVKIKIIKHYVTWKTENKEKNKDLALFFVAHTRLNGFCSCVHLFVFNVVVGQFIQAYK